MLFYISKTGNEVRVKVIEGNIAVADITVEENILDSCLLRKIDSFHVVLVALNEFQNFICAVAFTKVTQPYG